MTACATAVTDTAADPAETWAPVTERVVGFVDLAGSTVLAARLSTPAFARAMARFRSVTTATVGRWGGELVKVVGDGALFFAPDPATGVTVAFALIAACAEHPELPALRAGLALGEVVLDHGDCFGLPVNVAAKSAALARPGTVVATRAVMEGLGQEEGVVPGSLVPDTRLFHLPPFVELFELDAV